MVRPAVSALLLLLALLATSVLVAAQSDVPAGTSCSEPRVRKPWELYSDVEKTRYIAAVKLAIAKGYQQKFVELHVQWNDEAEAHQTCMFMYWHRMFLLGYENMLRSLGTEYACVTIPYWDHLSATARRASGVCNYIEGCSPIYQDFGGSTVGLAKSITVYNITVPRVTGATCVTGAMLSSFCGNSTTCAGCIVRGLAYKTAYPAEAYFASVYKQIFTYSDWASFATAVERGVHNTVHGAVGGAMAYFQSPIDPIFYTHHAFIDLVQTIYLKCQLGSDTALLDASEKGSDPRFWASCARRPTGTFSPDDTITMTTRAFNGQWVNVRTNPNTTLYNFFKDLPAKYSDYSDARDLGVYSYTFTLQGALTNMYTNCQASNTMDASTVTLLADDGAEASNSHVLKPSTRPPNVYDNKMRRWTIAIYESARLSGYTAEAASDQMEMILCVHKRDCLGGIADYDPIFRKNFGATGHPRCYTIIKQIDAGDRVIGIPKWRAITERFFPCTQQKKQTKKATTATAFAFEL